MCSHFKRGEASCPTNAPIVPTLWNRLEKWYDLIRSWVVSNSIITEMDVWMTSGCQEGHWYRIKNIVGSITYSWGTPDDTDVSHDSSTAITTLCVLLDRKPSIHSISRYLTQYETSLYSSFLLLTLSSALLKSSPRASNFLPWSRLAAISHTSSVNCSHIRGLYGINVGLNAIFNFPLCVSLMARQNMFHY